MALSDSKQPLVSIVTPVHDGEAFLEECVRSVLQQTYQNWEYVILDNASTDSTGEIAHEFARQDSRIRVIETGSLLPIMENWNLSMRQMDSESVYCKVVHADDFLLPQCLTAMVQAGDRYPNAGIVGAYAFWGSKIACTGLAYEEELLPGREICRRTLKREIYPFQSPSCLLIRSELVRQRDPFYRESNLHADVQMCYEVLRDRDFAFVHQILTYVRRHEASTTSKVAKPLNTIVPQNLDLLMAFGPEYLGQEEYATALQKQLDRYERFLMQNLHRNDSVFWEFHSRQLASKGIRLSRTKLRVSRAINRLSKKMKRPFRL